MNQFSIMPKVSVHNICWNLEENMDFPDPQTSPSEVSPLAILPIMYNHIKIISSVDYRMLLWNQLRTEFYILASAWWLSGQLLNNYCPFVISIARHGVCHPLSLRQKKNKIHFNQLGWFSFEHMECCNSIVKISKVHEPWPALLKSYNRMKPSSI